MYRFINYGKLFEQTDPAAPMPTPQVQQPAQMQVDPKKVALMLVLSEEDAAELAGLVESNADSQLFIRPALFVDKTTMDPNNPVNIPGFGTSTNLVLAIAQSDDNNADFPLTAGLDPSKHLIFNVYPKQITIDQLESGPVTLNLKPTTGDQVSITFVKAGAEIEPQTEPEMTETPEAPETGEEPVVSAEQAEEIADTGEMTAGMNPRAIKSFDAFVQESKHTWIKDVPMKKGTLRKEMGKKKGEEITAKELAKSEAKLKKKDKDKKKPGLQLNTKDAKTHKRNVLAKNLMKASGVIQESRQEKIKGTKEALVKLHEVIEKMIKQTSLKNKGI
jgi:hypothetical protein